MKKFLVISLIASWHNHANDPNSVVVESDTHENALRARLGMIFSGVGTDGNFVVVELSPRPRTYAWMNEAHDTVAFAVDITGGIHRVEFGS